MSKDEKDKLPTIRIRNINQDIPLIMIMIYTSTRRREKKNNPG
jgi:hypothetical protein